MRGVNLCGGQDILAGQVELDRRQPAFEIRRLQVLGGLHLLDAIAKLVDIIRAPAPSVCVHDNDVCFPFGVEPSFVRIPMDRPEAVHATHIVDAVHRAPP